MLAQSDDAPLEGKVVALIGAILLFQDRRHRHGSEFDAIDNALRWR
jgi:hypothetical protein